MEILKQIISEGDFKNLEKKPFPGFVNPMLATLTAEYFDNPKWIFERKLDGIRCLITINKGKANLYSRNENNISQSFPELKTAFEKEDYPNSILDGEIVAFDGKTTSFQKLLGRMQLKDSKRIGETKIKVFVYIFDILYFDGFELTQLPLKSRKKVLKKVIKWTDPIRFTPHRNKTGQELLKEACKKGWEGIIAKDSEGKYVHSRSKSWLKFKCSQGQELVIGGFTNPEGERKGFGALLVGYYKEGALLFAGKVGTGFDNAFLEEWRAKFDKIEIEKSPFTDYKNDNQERNHWIKPEYVGEFGFTEWTKSNKLRHPRFLGMRDDKNAKEVIKEI